MTDSRLVIVDSRTFLCACLHHPCLSCVFASPPPPSSCFHNLVFPHRRTDRVPEVRTGGRGSLGGGLGGRGQRGGVEGGGMAPKKADTTAGTGPPAVTKVILRRVPQNTDSTLEIHVGIFSIVIGCMFFYTGTKIWPNNHAIYTSRYLIESYIATYRFQMQTFGCQ